MKLRGSSIDRISNPYGKAEDVVLIVEAPEEEDAEAPVHSISEEVAEVGELPANPLSEAEGEDEASLEETEGPERVGEDSLRKKLKMQTSCS